MTIRSELQTALRQANDDLGETWQYRRRTSGPVAETRTYGSWTSFTANPTGRTVIPEWDEKRGAFKRVDKMRIRVSDSITEFVFGDQFKSPAGVEYAFDGVASHSLNTGTVAYDIKRDVPTRGEVGGREGGL